MAAKKKAQKVLAVKQSLFGPGEFDVKDVMNLSFFDMTGEKAKTKGSSNKTYAIEINQDKHSDRSQIYFIFGAVGGTQNEGWKHYSCYDDAKKEFDKIVKSKKRKGYVEVDVAQRAIGSDEAKKIVKPVVLKNTRKIAAKGLHSETARIVSVLMGSTNNWTTSLLRCPLGQLSNEQIEKGRKCLEQARQLIKQPQTEKQIEQLTNSFYSLIPHNLGSGARGQLTHLLLDSQDKINQKEYDLDTLLDAKAIGGALTDSSIYDQYNSLETNFDFIEHNDTLFKWLDLLVQKTKATNHRHLGKVVLLNAWKIQRNNEKEIFIKEAKKISKECGKQIIPQQMKGLVEDRPDGNDELFKKANVLPLFHGTRTQNVSGILKQGLLIRPSGVVITGAMYDGSGALYFSSNSTKSINYTNIKTSYWARGSDDRAFLFVSDCVLGQQEIASRAYPYTLKNIQPNHSVWAKGGQSGVINDEMILYKTNQHNLKYLLEFTCQRD